MSEQTTAPAPASDVIEARVFEQISKLRKASPADADVLIELTRQGVLHARRLRWAYYWLRVGSTLLGFAALVVMGIVATAFVHAGAIAPAGVSLGVGAGTVVAIFVTGRAAPALGRKPDGPR